MTGEMVLSLEEAKDVSSVGGKAAALGELTRAGFNVPNGFVITTRAFNQLTPKLKKLIHDNFDKLNAGFVAVRSSATAEDSKDAAWAGQFDTFLKTDRGHLIENVQKCWASSSSDRARAYAKEKGLRSGSLAVLVQEMINGDISGVAFSVHPVTKNSRHIIIEAVTGLAEGLVSGRVTPDSYIVDKGSYEVVGSYLTAKKPSLGPKQIKELTKTIHKIEVHSSFPVDVEWTFADGQIFILQSRPITTL